MTHSESRAALAAAQKASSAAHAELAKVHAAIARAESQRTLFKSELGAVSVDIQQTKQKLASAFIAGKSLPDVKAIEAKRQDLETKISSAECLIACLETNRESATHALRDAEAALTGAIACVQDMSPSWLS